MKIFPVQNFPVTGFGGRPTVAILFVKNRNNNNNKIEIHTQESQFYEKKNNNFYQRLFFQNQIMAKNLCFVHDFLAIFLFENLRNFPPPIFYAKKN